MRRFLYAAATLAAAALFQSTILVAHSDDQASASRPAAALSIPLEQLCGPHAELTRPAMKMRVAAGGERVKSTYGPGEQVIINAGTADGIRAGQRYLVRRVVEDQFAATAIGEKSISIHTAGWITILEAHAETASAVVSEACDAVTVDDYLDPLVIPPPAPAPPVTTAADYARPARVILGDERRQMGGEGTVMVIDRGSDHGLRIGQPLTVFRQTLNGKGPNATMGDAQVIEVNAETSLIRILRSREAIEVGDLVAIHR
jgi:hypothetical protein